MSTIYFTTVFTLVLVGAIYTFAPTKGKKIFGQLCLFIANSIMLVDALVTTNALLLVSTILAIGVTIWNMFNLVTEYSVGDLINEYSKKYKISIPKKKKSKMSVFERDLHDYEIKQQVKENLTNNAEHLKQLRSYGM